MRIELCCYEMEACGRAGERGSGGAGDASRQPLLKIDDF